MTKELTDRRKWIAVGQVFFAIFFPFFLMWLSTVYPLPIESLFKAVFANVPWQPLGNLIALGIILGGGLVALWNLPCSRQARIFILLIYVVLMTPAIIAIAVVSACNRGNCL